MSRHSNTHTMNSNYVLELLLVTCVLYYLFVSLKHNQLSSLALQQSSMSKQEQRQLQAQELQRTQQGLASSATAAGTLAALVGGGYRGGGALGDTLHAAMYTTPNTELRVGDNKYDALKFHANREEYIDKLTKNPLRVNTAKDLLANETNQTLLDDWFEHSEGDRHTIQLAKAGHNTQYNKGLNDYIETFKDATYNPKGTLPTTEPGFLISDELHTDQVLKRLIQQGDIDPTHLSDRLAILPKERAGLSAIPLKPETTAATRASKTYLAEEAAFAKTGARLNLAGSSVGAAVGIAAASALMEYFMGEEDEGQEEGVSLTSLPYPVEEASQEVGGQ